MPTLSRRDFIRLSLLSFFGAAALSNVKPYSAQTPTRTPLPPASKSMRGLYAVLKRNDDAIPADLLDSPLIAGVTLPIEWKVLQPSETSFTLDIIQGALSRVAAAKKKLALAPLAGVGSPAWLYTKNNVKKFTFTPSSDLYHPLEFGAEVSMPY